MDWKFDKLSPITLSGIIIGLNDFSIQLHHPDLPPSNTAEIWQIIWQTLSLPRITPNCTAH